MFKIRRYTASDKEAWNRFVADSKNGTFLFDRNYMDYHSDRFADFSLLVADAADRLIGLLPANRTLAACWLHDPVARRARTRGELRPRVRWSSAFACLGRAAWGTRPP